MHIRYNEGVEFDEGDPDLGKQNDDFGTLPLPNLETNLVSNLPNHNPGFIAELVSQLENWGDPQAEVLVQEARAVERAREDLVTEIDEESLISEDQREKKTRQLSRDLRRIVDIQRVVKPKAGENPYFNLVDDFNKKTEADSRNLQNLET